MFYSFYKHPFNPKTALLKIPLKNILFKEYDCDAYLASKHVLRLLPPGILNEIQNKTVDIIPYEISYIYFNNLNYDPRPLIQSYEASNGYLDRLNYTKYMSATAPDYVLFSSGQIDDRCPFWNESLTKLALLKHYKIISYYMQHNPTEPSLSNLILLKKTDEKLNIKEVSERKFVCKFDDTIPILKTENLVYLYANIKYSVLGQIRRFLFQPNDIKIFLKFENSPNYYNSRIALPLLDN